MSHDIFQAPDLETLGAQLPQFEFEFFIAQGGMGAVYKARQRSLERDVAIKILPHELGEDPEFRESFTKEAKAMARLNHPNLIGVFDSGDIHGMPYIVMEYVEGSSLHDSAWNQAVEPATAAAIVKAICDGLAHAHEHGITHRDIKPANILLNTKAVPKIGDFGLAHPADSEDSGLVMGTPGYTAPEVFVDPALAGFPADQYSVGVILHQLLTGIDPAGSEGPPTQMSGSIRLDAIWRKATQIDPANRYGSVAEMGLALQRWLESKSATPLNAGSLRPHPSRGGRPGPAAPPLRPASLSSAKSSGGGPGVRVALIVLLLAAIWFTYGQLKQRREAGEPPVTTTQSHPSEATKPDKPSPAQRDTSPDRDRSHSADSDDAAASSPEPEPFDPVASFPDPAAPTDTEHIPDAPSDIPDPSSELPPGDPELRQKAISLILTERTKRDALLDKNTKGFQLDLRHAARYASNAHSQELLAISNACEGLWLPEPKVMPELDDKMSVVYAKARQDQQAILDSHQAELARIRDYYVPILQKAAEDQQDASLKERLLAQAERARDLDDWIAALAPEAARSVPAIPVAGDAGNPEDSFVGDWSVVTDQTSHWHTKADGSVTVVGPGWQARWEILGDRSLQVTFDGKKPYHLTRDGNGWSGKTGYGNPIRITPMHQNPDTRGLADSEEHAKHFVGRWDSHTSVITKWVAEENGTITILDEDLKPKNWSGKWQARPGGIIWVQISDKSPHELVADGDGWIGHNGRKIQLKPAEW